MQSLVFGVSRAPGLAVGAPTVRLRRVACALAVLGSAFGCGSDDDDAGTVALADSGSLTALTNAMQIPTTVAVRDGVAWVAESQFDNYQPFSMTPVDPPGPFRLVGVPLAGGTPQSIPLPDNFFPEGVTVSLANRMYVGSVSTGAIYTVDPGTLVAREFVAAGTLDKPSAIGMAVSNDLKTLWVCNTVTSGGPPEADLVGIDTGTGAIVATHELPVSTVGSFCNDVVVAPNGNLWVTESFGGRLFRIPAAEALTNSAATLWLTAPDLAGGPNGTPVAGAFGVNGLTLVGGGLYVVNSSLGALFSIDPALAAPVPDDLRQVAVQEGGTDVLLSNPDGMAPQGESGMLIVENGLGLPGGKRLVRVDLQ